MAKPMSAAQIVAQLKKWGLKYAEYKSWETHNRNHVGAWGPVSGFMVHHTGSDSADQRALLYDGISGLPGPLCQFGLAQDGTVHLIGWGRANHAGAGDPDVLNAVVNESYGDYPPQDNQSSVDGNSRFYGVEIWYSGSHAMTAKQYEALKKLAAAICDFHGWSEKSVIGHGEWGSPGKWDPGIKSGVMMDMAKVRKDVKQTLNGGVSVEKPDPKPETPKPTPVKPLVPKFPGRQYFKVGVSSKHVTALDKLLVKTGFTKFKSGKAYEPGPYYSEYTKKNVQAFQKSLGWTGNDSDGLVGPETWRRLHLKAGYRDQ